MYHLIEVNNETTSHNSSNDANLVSQMLFFFLDT
jgi:hypothetical protein